MFSMLLIGRHGRARVTLVRALAFLLIFFSNCALAEDWTTADGKVYREVKVIRVEPDAITILYKDGGALIPLQKLSPTLQRRFSYDPIKAKAAAEARIREDAESARELQAEIDLTNKMKLARQIGDASARYSTNAPGIH
jgi:hypothetical protein